MSKNGLIRNIRLISKFIYGHNLVKKIAINILTNIFRSKDKAMKFVQLIEHNTRYIFLEKSYTKCVGDIIAGTFPKKLKLSLSLNQ